MTGGMTGEPEVLTLQHRFTEQFICVDRDDYLAGAHGRYRNWQMKGQGRFIAPPPLFPRIRPAAAPGSTQREDMTHAASSDERCLCHAHRSG